MMKCKFCGSNIDIESDVCPFCGLSKSQFESHREDMRDYSDAFKATREGVVKENKNFSSNAASITVLSILIIGILLLIIGTSQSYDIYYGIKTAKILRNPSVHIQRLDEALAENDYYAYYQYFYAQDISQIDRDNPVFAKYQLMGSLTIHYTSVVSCLQEYIAWDEEYYLTKEEAISRLAKQYSGFIDSYNRYYLNTGDYRHFADAAYSPEMITHMERLKQDLDQSFIAYLGVDPELLNELPAMSEAHRIVALENAIMDTADSAGKEDGANE